MFLLPETVARQDGTGSVLEVDSEFESRLVRLTLGITRIIAQENLDVSVWGSEDGSHWQLLLTFPQKFYCGTYQIVADLAGHPDVQYIRAKWAVNRWGKGEPKPLFSCYVFVQALQSELVSAGAA